MRQRGMCARNPSPFVPASRDFIQIRGPSVRAGLIAWRGGIRRPLPQRLARLTASAALMFYH